MSERRWDWIPGTGVGPCKFGTPVVEYEAYLDLKLVRPEGTSVTGWGMYEVGGPDKTVWTENGRIEAVQCEDFFIFKNKNLIGMSEKELIAHLEKKPDEVGDSVEYENGSIQTPYEFEDLGLEVWFEGGKLVSASATEIVDD